MTSIEVWKNSLLESSRLLAQFVNTPGTPALLERFSQILIKTYRSKGTVFICGNGGSHCDAMHFAEELTGKYRKERRPLGALALGDASHVTCTANDYGFDHVFSRQLSALARPGDCLIGLSTSGNSKNVLMAFEESKRFGLPTIGLLGKSGGLIKEASDLAIVVPGETSDRIQEIHMAMLHTVIEIVERDLFPENYK